MLISSMATQRRMQSGPGSRATISPVMAGGRPTSGQAGPGTRIMVPLRGGASGASRSGGYPVSYMQASTAVGQCSTAFSPYSQPSTSYPGQTRMASQMYGTSRTGGVLSHVAVAGSSQSYARSSPRIPSSSPRGAGRSVADAATAATATHGATAVKMITGGGGASSSVANRGRSAGVAADRSLSAGETSRSPRGRPSAKAKAGAPAARSVSASSTRPGTPTPRRSGSARNVGMRRGSSEPSVDKARNAAAPAVSRASQGSGRSGVSRSPSPPNTARRSSRLTGSSSATPRASQSQLGQSGSRSVPASRRQASAALDVPPTPRGQRIQRITEPQTLQAQRYQKPQLKSEPAQPIQTPSWCTWQGDGSFSPKQDLRPTPADFTCWRPESASTEQGPPQVEYGILSEVDSNSPTKRLRGQKDERVKEEKAQLACAARNAVRGSSLSSDENGNGATHVSPSPSTADLGHASSAPSLLSGGGALELSDSSNPSLTFSTNSSKEDAASVFHGTGKPRSTGRCTPELVPGARPDAVLELGADENLPPSEGMVPTPRTLQVAGSGGNDPLAKTVRTMRCFWEEKVRQSVGSKADSEAAPRRSQSEFPKRHSSRLRKEMARMQHQMDEYKDFYEKFAMRIRGPDALADDGSPLSKCSSSFESDNSSSKEEDESLMMLRIFRQNANAFSRYHRKTVDLMCEVLERFPESKLKSGAGDDEVQH